MSDERQVELYVYDLSSGLARQLSMQMLGRQIDAVYHTSIVFGGREYFFGRGIQTSIPGGTHHGKPMEVISLGFSALPDEIVYEYLGSMKSEYSPESYDLFLHNCNHFSNDLAMFLCGRRIPEHITDLPRTVLETPFGQMLAPALSMAGQRMNYAEPAPVPAPVSAGRVQVASSISQFDRILNAAKDKAAVAFFTSATCPPCRAVYPHFEGLAEENPGKAVFIKVDVGAAGDVGMKYSISATPTFITWSKGEQVERWSGASPADLKSNVQMLLTMTYPLHPHESVSLPITLSTSMQPIKFPKIPPFEKMIPKLGDAAKVEPAVVAQIEFLKKLGSEGAREAPVPDMPAWVLFVHATYFKLDAAVLLPVVDILRASLADPRISGWFAEEKEHKTVRTMLTYATKQPDVPYPIRLVTVQAACNLFSSPLFPPHLVGPGILPLLTEIITNSLLDKGRQTLRVAASSLAFNLAVHVQKERSASRKEVLDGGALVELAAGFIECLKEETESKEVVRGLTLSLALLVYCCPEGSEVMEMLKVLEAGSIVRGKGKKGGLGDWALCNEVAKLLEV